MKTAFVCRKFWRLASIALILTAGMFAFAADEKPANSILVYAYEFDRGNLAVQDVGVGYADKEPVVINGGTQPNSAEYDIEFPVTATYALFAKYTAEQSRPVDIFVDDTKIAQGFKSVTGSWMTSAAKWEKQCEVVIPKGKHTVKLVCPGPCIPHIVALRFDSSDPFPQGWKRKRKPISRVVSMNWSGKPTPGKYGYTAYLREDGTLDAPADYDPIVPFERIPPPTPNAERVLEFLLMGEGKYQVNAEIEKSEDAEDTGDAGDAVEWVARLSVKINDKRTETAVLPLSPERIRKMLNHALVLIDDFRSMPPLSRSVGEGAGVRAYLAAERADAEKMLRELEAVGNPKSAIRNPQSLYALYVRAYRLKNRVALSNPLLDFKQLLFVKRHTYDTSHIYTTYFDGSNRFGGNIHLLSPVRPDGQTTPLVKELGNSGIYRDPDLSWDAKRVLFSFKPDRKTANHVYEVAIDGTGLRQITNDNYDDVDPCYLPDGRIMFVSTRCRRVVLCHNAFTVSVLYTMNPDGSDVRCVSPNTVNEFTPSITSDGQAIYTRWEYIDKQVGNNQSLWATNPDGSGTFHIAGGHWGPVTLWEPREIPNSKLIVCTLAPHMPIAVGPIAIVDPNERCSSPAAFRNVTSELPPPRHFGWLRTDVGYYCNPFPLSDKYFIVSYAYGPGDREPAGYGIYLLDKWNNRDLIYRDPDISSFEAFPVKPRPRPHVLPPAPRTDAIPVILNAVKNLNGEIPRSALRNDRSAQNDKETETGTFYLVDVYRGLSGIERGTVKYLRIVEDIPKPVSANCQGFGLQHPLISNYGHYALKQVWGTVPVEADGSAYFKAPANKAIYFSALDENFMEVQRMRSFTHIAPGQAVTCIGCHEHRQTAPPNKQTLALRRRPSDITPPPQGVHAPDFAYDVQPVLNRHCVKCHNTEKAEGGVDLSPDYTNFFNVAYETLTNKGYVSFVNILHSSSLALRPPKTYGSHASKLVQVLLTTHEKYVKLPKDDFVRLVTWIDCNAPYYGTYLYSRPGTVGGRELLTPNIRAALDAIYAKRCTSCHGKDPERIHRLNFTKVAKSPALLAPLSKALGGTESCGKLIFADKSDPDLVAFTTALKQLEEEIRTKPREDMLTSRPPMLDEKCEYRYR